MIIKSRKLLVQNSIRVIYDIVFLNLSLILAIYLHYISFLFRQFNGFTFSMDFYLESVGTDLALWGKYAVPFSILSIGVFAVFGFYNTGRFKRFRQRFFSISLGTLFVNFLVIMLMYSMIEESFFPRGVSLIFLCLSFLIVALPRLIKPFIVIVAKYLEKSDGQNVDQRVREVLIIGGAGYVGSVMCRHFLSLGLKVKILDEFLFGDESIRELTHNSNFSYQTGDCRNISDIYSALDGVDAVVHLAGLVGDPACAVNDNLTIDINYASTKVLTELCKVKGIKRFVFASTCSVYGVSDEILNEESDLNPVSLYAKTKIDSEKILMQETDERFQPTVLRFTTVFGASPRQRFDLVVNTFVAKSIREGKIEVFGGNQWRPFVHTLDIARAAYRVLMADVKKVGGEIFNVGDNDLNLTIDDLAMKVKSALPGTEVVNNGAVDDPRNYKVSFDKIKNTLDFKCSVSVEDGIAEMSEVMKRYSDYEDLTSKKFNNFSQAKIMVAESSGESLQKLHMADAFSEAWINSSVRLSSTNDE